MAPVPRTGAKSRRSFTSATPRNVRSRQGVEAPPSDLATWRPFRISSDLVYTTPPGLAPSECSCWLRRPGTAPALPVSRDEREGLASTKVPNSEHLRFRVSGRLPGAHTWPGVAQWVPIDRGRKVVSSDGSCARLRGSKKMTGRPNLFQIGRPTRASSWSTHTVPARSRSPTLVPAHVRARACGVWP